MEPDFWKDCWQRGQIGFHQATPNGALERHWHALGLARGARVFVPLAGKSLDMIWLADRGHRVVGIELAQAAVDAFRNEHPGRTDVDLRCGDLFDLTPASLGPIDAVFDRAALVALPPAMRGRYARQLAALSPPGTRTLLVTFEYDPSRMNGPPHSVDEAEVRALYGDDHEIALLERDTDPPDRAKFVQRGLERLAESCYLLTKRR
jgi:thiopurine S-methyltransferase